MEDFVQGVWKIILDYWFVLSTVLATVLMAMFRTAQTNGKVDWLETGMCGIFAYGVWFVLSWFNLPEGCGVLVGGMVGYKGTHYVSKWVSKKLGLDEDNK